MSGLITPSLDEMCHVAAELDREGFDIPLMIGGATTSRVHTAVKIEPHYRSGPTVYVPDASRAVSVVSQLLGDGAPAYRDQVRVEYRAIREQRAAQRRTGRRVDIAAARANRAALDWAAHRPERPATLGTQVFHEYPLAELRDYIDWTPFFRTWDLAGHFPKILDDEVVGQAARDLYRDANAMLDRIIAEGWFEARAVVGLWPANARGDDIEVYEDESRTGVRATFHTLRQQICTATAAGPTSPCPTSLPRASPAWPTTWVGSR